MDGKLIFEQIFNRVPPKSGFQLWVPITQRAIWVESVEDAQDYLQSYSDEELLVSLATWPHEDSVEVYDSKLAAEEIASIPGFAVRFAKRTPDRERYIKPDWDDAINLVADLNDPTMLVNTGDGLEAVWLFDKPLKLRSADQSADMVKAYRSFANQMKVAARIHGWEVQNIDDVPFWLHLPDTMNHDVSPAEPVKLVFAVERKHDVRLLLDYSAGESEPLSVPTITSEVVAVPPTENENTDGLARLNDHIGTDIRKIVMYKGDQPDFDFHIWDPYDDRLRVLSLKVREVLKLSLFRERLSPYMKDMINNYTMDEWSNIAQTLFDCAERLDMGDQETSTSHFRALCTQYILSNPATNKQPKQAASFDVESYPPWLPVQFPQHVIIHAPSLIRWLNAAVPNHGFTQRMIYRAFHALGGEPFSTQPSRSGGARYRGWKVVRSQLGLR